MSDLLLDPTQLHAKLTDMAHALAEYVTDPEQAAIIGIRTRGALLAQRIHRIIALEREWNLPLGILDITLYRDDLSQLASFPLVRKTQLDFDITGRTILLIDDVIYTGRTIRSAIDEIIDFGRPSAIRLGILVDRGGREYPLQPDVAGLTIQAHDNQVVKVLLKEVDLDERVIVTQRPNLPPAGPDIGV
jgi:pyrimidine operon attenuation protein/uracil phosphoribosyltransferase